MILTYCQIEDFLMAFIITQRIALCKHILENKLQFSQSAVLWENRARTNFPIRLQTEGAPIYEQRQARSAGERVSAALRIVAN